MSLAAFISFVQVQEPMLGKALDYLLTASLEGGQIIMELPAASPPLALVKEKEQQLGQLAARFWAEPRQVVLRTRHVAAELRLLPVESSKYWNDLVFFLPHGEGCDQRQNSRWLTALVISKPDYATLVAQMPVADHDVHELVRDSGGGLYPASTLEEVMGVAGRRAQKKRGICHAITLCTSRPAFLDLDYRFYRMKDFGVDGLGPLITRSVIGRLHAVFPGQYCSGLTIVHQASAHH
ncbi:MAG: hypothetical protein JXO49_09060 [Deltaproteobacteria bacterium]|nr:hypothetical protein [Candidatus Anaeroferrophillus wilburensis]MBN2889478.1 hypothetical protein [Deltaproteobacteria bacterium]